MAKGKQQAKRKEAAGDASPSESRSHQEPPSNPPRRNLPLLIVCTVIFALWFAFLAYTALSS